MNKIIPWLLKNFLAFKRNYRENNILSFWVAVRGLKWVIHTLLKHVPKVLIILKEKLVLNIFSPIIIALLSLCWKTQNEKFQF